MNGTLQRLLVLVVSAAAAFGVWEYGAGSKVDRIAFQVVASAYANPPLFVTGEGTHESAWKLRVFSQDQRPDKKQAPVIVSLGDDVDGFFQSSPPAPIDLAVIFRNFQRLGAKKAATAAVFAWDSPDPIGFAAFEASLSRFDSLVMAAPLSRGSVPSSMPPAFRRASIPFSSIPGDGSAIPVVDWIPIPNVVLSGEKTLAGFTVLELGGTSRLMPLMARWNDRVVFSFSLMTVLQRLNISPDSLDIRPGEYLKIGADGPILPIDVYGQLAAPLKQLSAYAEIPAEALIDGGEELFPKNAPEPVILRDDRSAADVTTRAFSKALSGGIAAIASDESLARLSDYPRLIKNRELGLLAGAVLISFIFCSRAGFRGYVAGAVIAAIFACSQWVGFGVASVWLPGLPALVGLGAALLTALVTTRSVKNPSPPVRVEALPAEVQPIAAPPVEKLSLPLPEAEAPSRKKPAEPKVAAPEQADLADSKASGKTPKAPAKKSAPAKKAATKVPKGKKKG